MLCNLSKPLSRILRRQAQLLLIWFIIGGLAISLSNRTTPAGDAARVLGKTDMPFTLPTGFVAERIADSPLIEHPMFACFDDRGRLFVADSRGINPKGAQLDQKPEHVIRLLESSRNDGRFDKSTVFAEKLTYPEGVLWHDGAVFTA